MNTVSFLILIIVFERTNSKDLLLTLADEKKTIKKVTIDEKNKDENNRDVEPKPKRKHSGLLGQSEDTAINFPAPESGAALETIGQDYNNDATENRSSLQLRKRVRVANRCRPKKTRGLKFECRYKRGSR